MAVGTFFSRRPCKWRSGERHLGRSTEYCAHEWSAPGDLGRGEAPLQVLAIEARDALAGLERRGRRRASRAGWPPAGCRGGYSCRRARCRTCPYPPVNSQERSLAARGPSFVKRAPPSPITAERLRGERSWSSPRARRRPPRGPRSCRRSPARRPRSRRGRPRRRGSSRHSRRSSQRDRPRSPRRGRCLPKREAWAMASAKDAGSTLNV